MKVTVAATAIPSGRPAGWSRKTGIPAASWTTPIRSATQPQPYGAPKTVVAAANGSR
jgi:hypothetical protein